MPIYLHDRYDKKIQEAFVKESVIKGLLANDYDFSGVKTVKISTLQTVPMNDYQRTGTNRYGTPVEMEDTVQELTMTQDKGFAITIDKGNKDVYKRQTVHEAIAMAIASKAIDGNLDAAEMIRDTIGEKPADSINLNNNMSLEGKLKRIVGDKF